MKATSEKLISNNPDTTLQRPWRAPIEIHEVLASYYEGKRVVHIGHAAGDLVPGWAAHAKEVIGYEADPSRYAQSAQRQDLKNLDNVILIQQTATPENLVGADFYYCWMGGFQESLGDNLKAAGKKSPFTVAFYGGWAERDLVEHPHGGAMCFMTEEELKESDYEVVYFNSKELDNRP